LFIVSELHAVFNIFFTFTKNYTLQKELILQTAIDTLSIEKIAIENLLPHINDAFTEAIEEIHKSTGRLIISGIGKSAIIAQKIVATLNSTGTPSTFLHAADAIHGDLGMIQMNDIVMIISKSGESPEIKVLVPLIKNFGNTTIALCGKETSFLATHAHYFINCTVEVEACPNNLAPTSSTTAQMVMGDAMAVCLLKLKGFTPADFAKFHPGGALGKRLYMKVSDLSNLHAKPQVHIHANIKEVILEITSKRLGATAVLNDDETLAGIITDGDIRRMLEAHDTWNHLQAKDIMNTSPKNIQEEELAVNAVEKMRSFNISQLLVLNENKYAGIVHIHDLLREGLI